MNIFLDTSTLVKLYYTEVDSATIETYITTNKVEEIYLSNIAKTEYSSAICKKLRTKNIDENIATFLLASFEKDYPNYTFISLSNELVDNSNLLIKKYGNIGLRTLDSLQLASAL